MGCNASNHPPHNNPSVRSTSYSIFRRCRRRKKNKEEQNDEYNDEELKRKIDLVSAGAGGGDDANKDINFSHQGFNFLGNSFSKNYFKSASGGAGGGKDFFEEGEQEDGALNNKNSRSGGSSSGGGIFVNVPLLAQSQASSSQLDFFSMLDQKIQEGPDFQTPSSSCCSLDIELDDAGRGDNNWNKMRGTPKNPPSAKNNHNHQHRHHHYHLLHHEAKNRWKPFLSSVDKPPPGYNHVNCIIQTKSSSGSSSSSSGGVGLAPVNSSSASSSPVVGLFGGGGARTNHHHTRGGNSNNNFTTATVITNNSAKDYYFNDKRQDDHQC